MNKFLLPLLLVMLALGFGGGYLTAKLMQTQGLQEDDASDEKTGGALPAGAVAVQEEELRQLRAARQELEQLEATLAGGGDGAAALQQTIDELREQASLREREIVQLRGDLEKAQAASAKSPAASSAFDLTELREKYDVLAPVMLTAYEAYNKLGPEKRTPEEYFKIFSDLQKDHDTKFMEWLLAFISAVNKTRAQSPRLFFDEQFLPDLLVMLYEAPLELTEQQVGGVRDAAIDLARKYAADLDTSVALASVVYKARWDLSTELGVRMDVILSADQMEKFEALQMMFSFLFRGSQTTYGLGVVNAQQAEAKLLEKYTEVYGLDETQQGSLRAILAGNHAPERMIEVVTKYGFFKENAPSRWEQDIKIGEQLDYELLALQIDLIDAPLKTVLTAEQIDRVNTPQLVQLVYGEENGVLNNNNMGY